MSDLATLNKVQYAGLDFNTLSDELLGRLQIQFAADFNDFALSSMGIMLLDVIAFGLDSLAFYLDRRATDNFLATARTRKSVAKLTRQLGYKMRGAAAASTSLSVGLPSAPALTGYAFNVPIPKGFQFKGPDGLIFEAAEEVVFPAGWLSTYTLSVPVYQGESLSETFVSTGEKNQVFTLRKISDASYVVAGTVEVTVAGAAWTEKDFLEYEETNHFEVGYNDSPVTVRFGDGAAGNVPVAGATVTITYVACRGKAGRVAKDTITSEVTPLTVSFTNIALAVNNDGPAVGGDDPEDIEHAKAFAGRVFKTRQVAITKEDYQSLSGSFADPLFGRIAVAQAFSARDASTDLALKSYVDAIYDATVLYADDVKAAADSLETQFVSMVATLSSSVGTNKNLLQNLTDIAASSNIASTNNTSATTAVKSARVKVSDANTSAGTGLSQATSAKTTISGIATGAANSLTAVTRDNLLAALDTTLSALSLIQTNCSAADTNISSAISALDTVTTELAKIGVDLVTSDTSLYRAAQNRSALLTIIGTAPGGLYVYTNTIKTRVNAQVKTTILTSIDDIEKHFSQILSADCKANVVTVPVLSKNGAGFYAAPSLSLMASLQKYLDARKEVTHTVFVVSGSPYLVRPKITVKFGIKPSYSGTVIAASISAAIDALLRDRAFGQPLYNSDIVDAIKLIEGVAYTNVTINGYTRDGSLALAVDKVIGGNLVVLDSEVITKATDDAGNPQIIIEVDS